MQPSLRRTLADSHVAAVAIAVLLLSAFELAFEVVWDLLYGVGGSLVHAIVSHRQPSFNSADHLTFIGVPLLLFLCLADLAVAIVLSLWVYQVGPLACLSAYRTRFPRRHHA